MKISPTALFVAMIATAPLAYATTTSPFKGDVDGDYRIDVSDLLALQDAIDGLLVLPPDAITRADLDGDGLLTEADFTKLTFPALDATSVPPFGSVAAGTPVIESVTPSFGEAGEHVVVSGYGFAIEAADNEVRIGEAVATIVSAGARSLEFIVPASCGPLSVRNLQSGHSSLCASFVVAGTDHPKYDFEAPAGDVAFVTPDEVLLPNAVFTVPLAVKLGESIPGVVHAKMSFDPEHVEALCVENLLEEWYTPLPPSLDHAAGVLGAGAMRRAHLFKSGGAGADDTVGLFEVGFKVLAYRAHAPVITARVEALVGDGFPAPAFGAPTPRFAADTAQLHPAPDAPFPGWSGEVSDRPLLVDVEDPILTIDQKTPVEGENLPTGKMKNYLLGLIGDQPFFPKAVVHDCFFVKPPEGTQSGPLVLIDMMTGAISNDLLVVVPESDPPKVEWTSPKNGASFQSAECAVFVGFSEALNGATMTFARQVRLTVTPPGEASRFWPSALATTTGGESSIRIRPLLPFPAGATVRVEIDRTIQDLSGNVLAPIPAPEFLITP